MNERPPPDISLAVDAGVRWMSYADIAAARGVNVESITRMVRRKKWRRQPGNGPAILVAVPLAELARTNRRTKSALPGQAESPLSGQDAPPLPGQKGSPSPDIASIARGFEAALAVLSEQLTAERSRSDALRDQLDAAEKDRARAVAEIEALREADRTRRTAGRLARIRAAWRGE
jgi:hypothetical protein